MDQLTPELFWDMVGAYHLGSSRDFYESVGGGGLARAALGNPAYENTCAARLSDSLTQTFTKHGLAPLSPNANGDSLPGADGHQRIFRVRALREALADRFGEPEVYDIADRADLDAFAGAIVGRPGVFVVEARFSDSTGHVGLWDGDWCRDTSAPYACYFGAAHRVHFWPATEPPLPQDVEPERGGRGIFTGFFGGRRGEDSGAGGRTPAPSLFLN